MSTTKLTTKPPKEATVVKTNTVLNHAIDNCDDKKDCCDIEKYMKALVKNFYSDLVVAAYPVPGLEHLLSHGTNGWSGSLIVLLESIIARLPKIYNYTVLKADTAEEAQDFVRSGKAVFDITPTLLFPNVLDGDLSYIAVSKTVTGNVVLAYSDCTGFIGENIDAAPASLEEVFKVFNVSADDITVVTTKSLYASYVKLYGDQEANIKFIEEDEFPNSVDVLKKLAGSDGNNACNTVYLGPYGPLYCADELPEKENNSNDDNFRVRAIPLTVDEQALGYGWAIARYNARWQVWLQFVLDVLVKCGNYKQKVVCEDDECVPLALSAPPAFYSFCQNYIPRSAPGDLLLPDLRCTTPHKVVQNGTGCAGIVW